MRKFVLAIDSFKGCMSSAEAENAVAEALHERLAAVETVCLPMSDGGEGMLEAFTAALGGYIIKVRVHDPLMRPIEAVYGVSDEGTAIIEVAKACGLCLLRDEERNPLRATTYGVGELVADAVERGCRRFLIGLGGSGTSDAGMGMLRALTDRLAPRGGTIDDCLRGALGQCRFTVACDVRNPLCGPDGATAVFAPQKGATPVLLPLIERRTAQFAQLAAHHFGNDCSDRPGAGAAGGLGYAFMQYLRADMRPGADVLLDMAGFDAALQGADCVITGEGRADRQTLMGKLPQRVMERAKARGIPVWLLAGEVDDGERLREAGFARVERITPAGTDKAKAMKKETATRNLKTTVAALVENRNSGGGC